MARILAAIIVLALWLAYMTIPLVLVYILIHFVLKFW